MKVPQWHGGKSFEKRCSSTRLQLRGSAGFAPASLHSSAMDERARTHRLEKNDPEILEG